MPLSLRLGALLFAAKAVSASRVIDDEESLIQDVKKQLKTHRKTDSKPLAGLLESAKGFLKNGVTPDVVSFADETLAEVTGIVIPAILNESRTDQAYIYTEHAKFQQLLDELRDASSQIRDVEAEQTTASEDHRECRDQEDQDCSQKRQCETELYRLWTEWVTMETNLRQTHSLIDGHFCHGANGTLHTFRIQSVPWMHTYMTEKVAVDAAMAAYDLHLSGDPAHDPPVPGCADRHAALDATSSDCNGYQTTLEAAACSNAVTITDTLATLLTGWNTLIQDYERITTEIRILEADRHREYSTLTIVQCLLSRVHELNGRPCDEESGEVATEMSACEQEGSDLVVCNNEPDLCIIYPDPPPMPEPCANQAAWDIVGTYTYLQQVYEYTGICLPVVQPYPCNPDFESQEYSGLPGFPQEPFTAENPGCNAYPECNACTAMTPVAQPTLIMMDGCATAGSSPEREVVGVGDGRTASVRCCSFSGDVCDSDHLPGGCQSDKTFAEAEEICDMNGERLCTEVEIDSRLCCGTGCSFDSHQIWVSDGSASYSR